MHVYVYAYKEGMGEKEGATRNKSCVTTTLNVSIADSNPKGVCFLLMCFTDGNTLAEIVTHSPSVDINIANASAAIVFVTSNKFFDLKRSFTSK